MNVFRSIEVARVFLCSHQQNNGKTTRPKLEVWKAAAKVLKKLKLLLKI